MKVYVIEDNPVYCKYICNLLAKEGFETETMQMAYDINRCK